MKALSLLQPWATLVACGAKKVETRSWKTNYRGEIAIHASKGYLSGGKTAFEDLCMSGTFRGALDKHMVDLLDLLAIGITPDLIADLFMPFGAIVAKGRIVRCSLISGEWMPDEPELSFGDYTIGRYAWFLEDVEPFSTPIPAKGSLGLWEWNESE